tara:strand:+ start:43 stop:267 length:225 start_codon:yes stop_codon:yes gene_type:complete
MYLILTTPKADIRNKQEAVKRGWKVPNAKVWSENFNDKGDYCALAVGDGEGLTKDELAECVDNLPIEFIHEIPS